MSSQVVQDTMWQFLAANWKETPIVDIDNTLEGPDQTQFEGVINTVPHDACPWITLQFFFAPEEHASFGNPGANYWREDGQFLLYIYVPTGTGTTLIKEYGKALQDLFRGQEFNAVQGIQITDISAPAPREEQPIQEGMWYALGMAITYYCFKQEEPYHGVPN